MQTVTCACCAGSHIAGWVEADSSILVTESPLALINSTLQNNKAGTDKAVIESWYGALVRLQDVQFSGNTGTLLLNDDPAYNSENGVFFAPEGVSLTVRTDGGGVRSTRPLSEAPGRFLTLEDAGFLALQEVSIEPALASAWVGSAPTQCHEQDTKL